MLLPGARLELHNLTLLLPGVTPEARAAAPASVLAHVLSFGDGVGNGTGSGGGANITGGDDSSGSIMVLLSGVSLVLASDTDHGAFLQALCEPLAWRYSGAGELQVIDGVAVYGDSTMQLLPPASVAAATAEAAAAAPLARLLNTRAGVSGVVPPPWVCSATHVSDAASLLSTARELLAKTSITVLLSLAGNVTLDPDSWGAGVTVPWNTYLGLYGVPSPGQAVQVDFGGIVGAIDAGPYQGSLIIRDLVLLGLPYPGEVASTKDLMAAWLHAVFVERYFGPHFSFSSRVQLQCIRCTLVLPEQELVWWRNAAVAAQTADSGSTDSPFMGVSWRFTVESAAALDAGANSPPPAPVMNQHPGLSSLSLLRISLEDNKYDPHIRFSACSIVSLGSSGVATSPRAAAAAAVWPFGARYSVEEAAQLRLAGFRMAHDRGEQWMDCDLAVVDAVVVPSRWRDDTMPSQYTDWIRPGGRSPKDSFMYADPQTQPWTASQNRPCTVHGPPSSQTGRQTLWDARGIVGQRTLPPGSPLTLEELVLYNLPPAGPNMEEAQGAPPPMMPPPMTLQSPATSPVYGSLAGEQAPSGVPRRAGIEWTGGEPLLAPTYAIYPPPAAPAGPPPAAPPAAAGPLSRLALPLWNFQMNRFAEPPLLLLHRVTLVVPPAELSLLLRVLAANGVLPRAPPPQPQPPREQEQRLKAGSAPPPQVAATGSRDGFLGRRLLPRWDAAVSDLVPAAGRGPVPSEGEGQGARGEQQPAGEGARVLQAQGVSETQSTAAAATAAADGEEDCPLAVLLRFAAGADVASYNETSIVFRAVSFHGWAGRDVTVTSVFPPDSPTRRLISGITVHEYDELLAECPLLGLQFPRITPPAPHPNDTAPPATQRPPLPSSSADSGAGSMQGGSQQGHPPPLSPRPAWVGAAAASGGGGKAAVNVVAVAVAVPIGVAALALLVVVGGAVLLVRRRRAVPPSAALPAEGLKQQEGEQEQRPQQQAGQEGDGTAAGSSGGGSDGAAPPSGHLGAEASKSVKEMPQDINRTDLSTSPPALVPLLRANGGVNSGGGQRPEAPTSDPRCVGAPGVATAPVSVGGVALLSMSRSDGNGGDGARQPPGAPPAHPVPSQDSSIPAQPSTPQTPLRSCSPQQPGQATPAAWAAAQGSPDAAASPGLCVPTIVIALTGDRTAAAGTDGPASSSVLGLGRSPPGLETSSLQAYLKVREAGLNGAGGVLRGVVHLSPAYRCRAGEPSKWGGGSLRRAIERWRDALEQESGCAGEGEVRLLQAIGSGSYGTVYLGVWRGLPVAAKVLVIHNTLWGPEGRARHRAVLEAAVGASLNHPNVVATYAYDVTPMEVIEEGGPPGAGSWDSGSGRDPWVSGGGAATLGHYDVYQLRILQEFCAGGSLKDALETSGALGGGVLAGGAAAATALLLALDVVCGLRHVHAAGIVHGDISSGNVLLARHSRPAAQQLCNQQAVPPPPSGAQAHDSSGGNRAAAARATAANPAPNPTDCAQGAVGGQATEMLGEERQGGGAERDSGEVGEGGDGCDAREAAWRARLARALGLWRRRCPDLAAADVVAKVADFGLSVRLLGSQTHASGLRQGTPIYMAPEVLGAGRISRRSDVYSFGVLLLELIHGAPAPAIWAATAADPLRREALQHAHGGAAGPLLLVVLDSFRMREGGEGSAGSGAVGAVGGVVGGYCPEGLRELAAACLATDPAQRPTLDQAADVLVKCIEAVGADSDGLQAAERRGAAQLQGQETHPSHAVA